MAEQPQSVTSIGQSPEEERRGRVVRYSLIMLVRLICIFLAVAFPGGAVMWLGFIGAIFLPYVAVVLANAVSSGTHKTKAKAAEAPTLVISADAWANATKTTTRASDTD